MFEMNEITTTALQKNRKLYLAMLRMANVYDCSDCPTILFDYTYNENEILALREKYQLNMLIGGNEDETFINAINWVSLILESDKKPKGPVGNSAEIIQNVIDGNCAANCYAYAVVLNDVLCALGYKSKYIFCYPIDFHFYDCHVVNLVYSSKRKKWVLLDAANNVYYTDEQGNMLDLNELRYCLINEKKVEVNLLDKYKKEKNINKALIKQKLLTYMTKNLYRFGCFLNSQKDRMATYKNIYFYHLVPVSYIDVPQKVTEYRFENRIKKIESYMSNSDLFWKLPEKE